MKLQAINRIGDIFNKAVRAVAAVCLALMLIIVLLQVGTRALSGSGLSWGNEATTYLLVWGISLGAAYAFWDRSHLAVDFILVKLKRSRKFLELFIFGLIYTFLGIFAYYGWQMTTSSVNMSSPAMRLSLSYVYLAIPVSAVVAIINITLVIASRKPAPTIAQELDEEIQGAVGVAVAADLPEDIAESATGEAQRRRTGDDADDDDENDTPSGRGNI